MDREFQICQQIYEKVTEILKDNVLEIIEWIRIIK